MPKGGRRKFICKHRKRERCHGKRTTGTKTTAASHDDRTNEDLEASVEHGGTKGTLYTTSSPDDEDCTNEATETPMLEEGLEGACSTTSRKKTDCLDDTDLMEVDGDIVDTIMTENVEQFLLQLQQAIVHSMNTLHTTIENETLYIYELDILTITKALCVSRDETGTHFTYYYKSIELSHPSLPRTAHNMSHNDYDGLSVIVRNFFSMPVCQAISYQKFPNLTKTVFKDLAGKVIANVVRGNVIHDNCEKLIFTKTANKTTCGMCTKYVETLRAMDNRKRINAQKPTTTTQNNTNWRFLTQKEAVQRRKSAVNKTQALKIKIKTLIEQEGVELPSKDAESLEPLFKDLQNNNTGQSFKNIFVKEHSQLLSLTNPKSRRYHPVYIQWALQLYLQSPKAYELLKQTGIIALPNKRTLIHYKNIDKPKAGIIDNSLLDRVKRDFNNRRFGGTHGNNVGLIFDEVSLKKDLVFDKGSGRLLGFVDLGKTYSETLSLEKALGSQLDPTADVSAAGSNCDPSPQQLATNMFVFMLSSATVDFKWPVAFFPVIKLESHVLYDIFWELVEALELWGFNVIFCVCDGASCHRKFFKLHQIGDETIVHKVKNPYSERFIFFVSDPVHLLKTTRNNLENSFFNNKTRTIKNNGTYLKWTHLVDALEGDLNMGNDTGLRVMPKVTVDHLYLNPFLRMRVYLAAQVFSNRMAFCLESMNIAGVDYVIGTRINQDPLEKFFGKLRQRGRANTSMNIQQFNDALSSQMYYSNAESKAIRRSRTQIHPLQTNSNAF